MDSRTTSQLAFLLEIDKLKTVLRRNRIANGARPENTAEHSWHLVVFALVFAERMTPDPEGRTPDLAKTLALCAIHDLVEIDAGDTFFWDEKGYEDKRQREEQAADRLFGLLPVDQAAQFRDYWEEFESCSTPESLMANAVDKLAPVLLNSHSGGASWKENGVTATMIRQKMTVVAKASPELGLVLDELIESAVAKGFLVSGF